MNTDSPQRAGSPDLPDPTILVNQLTTEKQAVEAAKARAEAAAAEAEQAAATAPAQMLEERAGRLREQELRLNAQQELMNLQQGMAHGGYAGGRAGGRAGGGRHGGASAGRGRGGGPQPKRQRVTNGCSKTHSLLDYHQTGGFPLSSGSLPVRRLARRRAGVSRVTDAATFETFKIGHPIFWVVLPLPLRLRVTNGCSKTHSLLDYHQTGGFPLSSGSLPVRKRPSGPSNA